MADFESSPLSLDLGRISYLCEEEWRAFLQDIDAMPVPQRQDLRGFLLNWVAAFVPAGFPQSLQSEMSAWMEEQIDRSQAMDWGYTKPPLIGSTLFALTGQRRWLRIQFENFADGGSLVRNFFHKSLALVGPRITFDSGLLERLNRGMTNHYFYMDVPLVLYAVSIGSYEEKMANFKRWQEGFLNSREKDAVDGFVEGHPVANPLQYWMLENTTYVAMRLASFPMDVPRHGTLPLGVAFSSVWEHIKQHPLFSPYIELKPKVEEKPRS